MLLRDDNKHNESTGGKGTNENMGNEHEKT